MAKFKALSRGTQIVLVAAPLLLLSLFFTWQNVEVDYGPAGVATASLDGFDAWGLLLALLALSTVTLVTLRNLTDVDMSDDISWEKIAFGLGVRDSRRRGREEPHRRGIVMGELRVRRAGRRRRSRYVSRLGGDATRRVTSPCWSESAAGLRSAA